MSAIISSRAVATAPSFPLISTSSSTRLTNASRSIMVPGLKAVSSKLFLTPAASANFCCAFMALSCRIFPAPSLSQRANHLAHAHQTTSILTLVARTLLSFHPSSILLLTPDSSPLALTFLTVLLLSSLLPSFATLFPTSHSLTHSFVLLSYPSLNLILSPLASSHFPFFSPLSSPSSRFVPCSSDSCLLSYPILSYPLLFFSSSPLLLLPSCSLLRHSR
mmetsp:Transcript_25733/g.57871  ORF Transcript_25733/g.57871 Transcript_25733/m.57871 type:complete len:220 (+) Transcript_25733:3132-3791(+)